MGKKRKRALLPNHPLLLPEIPEKGPPGDRLKAALKRVELSRLGKLRALDGFRLDYEETGNPLAAWDAFLFARENNLPLPEWVLKYLDGTARRLLRADNNASVLGWCFGFDSSGGPGPWQQYRTHRMKLLAASCIAHRVNADASEKMNGKNGIFDDAAQLLRDQWEQEINPETVQQWAYRDAAKTRKAAVVGCSVMPGYPTIIRKENHGLIDGDFVVLSGATGKDADLLNGKECPVIYATKDSFALDINTTGAAAMGGNITATP